MLPGSDAHVSFCARFFDVRAERALWILAFACFLTMSSWFSAAAILPELQTLWQLSPTGRAALTMAVQIGFVVGSLISAILTLADVYGPRRLILVGAGSATVANAGLLLASSLLTALPWRFATGCSLALVYPPFVKLMATWFRGGRGTALGILLAGLTLGSAVPHLLRATYGGDVRLVTLGSSLLTLIGGGIVWFTGKEGPFAFSRAGFAPKMALQIFAVRSLRLAVLGYLGHMWELYAMWAWFPLFMRERLEKFGWTERSASLMGFFVIASGAVGCWRGGVLGDRRGRTWVTAWAMALSGTCALLIGPVGQAGWSVGFFLGIAFIWGLSVNADSAQFTCMVTELADQAYVGTALTMQLAAGFLLTNLTIWLLPQLLLHSGWSAAFASLALGPAIGVLAMCRLRTLTSLSQ